MNITRTFFVLAENSIEVSKYNEIMKQDLIERITFRASAIINTNAPLELLYQELETHNHFKQTFEDMCKQYSNIINFGKVFLTSVSLLEVKHDS